MYFSVAGFPSLMLRYSDRQCVCRTRQEGPSVSYYLVGWMLIGDNVV